MIVCHGGGGGGAILTVLPTEKEVKSAPSAGLFFVLLRTGDSLMDRVPRLDTE